MRVPGHKTKLFSDSKFTFGQASQSSRLTASLLAATEHRISLLPIGEGDGPAPLKLGGMAVAENSGKQHKTGCPGVFSHHDGKSLLVVVKGMPTRTIPTRMGVDAAIAIRNRLANEKAQKLGVAKQLPCSTPWTVWLVKLNAGLHGTVPGALHAAREIELFF